MLGFLVILLAVLVGIMSFSVFMLRYVVPRRFCRRVRVVVLLMDALFVIGLFLGRGVVPAGSTGSMLSLMAMVFMTQFLLAVFTLAAIGIRYIWRRMQQVPFDGDRRRLLRCSMLYPAAAAAAGAYGGVCERNSLVCRDFNIPVAGLDPSVHGFCIAQLSDVHLGMFFSLERLRRLLQQAVDTGADVLVLTGDIFDDDAMNVAAVQIIDDFVMAFPAGIFFCYGNHEHMRDMHRIQAALENTRIQVLVNEHVQLQAGTRPLYLAGVDYPFPRDDFAALEKSYTTKALEGIPSGAVTVLLAHHPDFIDDGYAHRVRLVLSGHTHGGQLGLFGIPLVPPLFHYMRGMYEKDGCSGYVHSGNGSWFPYRLGCPPEIACFHLIRTGKEPEYGKETGR